MHITIVACPARGAGNDAESGIDAEALGLVLMNFACAINNKSCQKPTIELAGRLGEKLNISPLDIGHK